MKINSTFFLLFLLSSFRLFAQSEPFTQEVLNQKSGSGNYHLAHPWDIVYGPDNYLYITEKIGRVVRVNAATGVMQVILDHRASVQLNITPTPAAGNRPTTGIGQNGMLGLALDPNFLTNGYIYVAYSNTYTTLRISRFTFTATPVPALTSELILLSGIPASNDHTTGRIAIGPDNKIYYSAGDLGNNQFNNKCQEIRSQMLLTSGDVATQNYVNYTGKILRINLDGSIPSDNPLFNSVRSHIYTVGHRNPQGLVFEKNGSDGFTAPTLKTNGKLFSSEHGPNTGDELNIIESGKNYGWPYISGVVDNSNYQYTNWSSAGGNCNTTTYQENPFLVPAGATVTAETAAPSYVTTNFKAPLQMAYTTCGARPAAECALTGNWLKYPTIAPSSIEYYSLNAGKGIPGWYPSLLVPTLRTGTVYRYKLNTTGDAIVGDSIPYFKTVNRYRDIAMAPDGRIFLITDSIGSTSGPSGADNPNLVNRGDIVVYQYIGTTLALKEPVARQQVSSEYVVSVFPNPASSQINVEYKGIRKPINYRLYDMAGRLVSNYNTTSDVFSINVEHLRRGVYILKIYNGYGVEVKMEKVVLR